MLTRRYFPEGEQQIGVGDGYYTRDHLGSIREVIGTAGSYALAVRYDYDAWGNRTKVEGAFDVDWGFTGHYYHATSGLYLAPYRAYDPTVGRWLSRDPLKEAELRQGPNLYVYVHNNPTVRVDLSGLLDPGYVVKIGVSAGVGGLVANWPGAVIGAIAGAIIFAPATAQAPSPTNFNPCPEKRRTCVYSCETQHGSMQTLTEVYPGQWGSECPKLRTVDPDTGHEVDCNVVSGPE